MASPESDTEDDDALVLVGICTSTLDPPKGVLVEAYLPKTARLTALREELEDEGGIFETKQYVFITDEGCQVDDIARIAELRIVDDAYRVNVISAVDIQVTGDMDLAFRLPVHVSMKKVRHKLLQATTDKEETEFLLTQTNQVLSEEMDTFKVEQFAMCQEVMFITARKAATPHHTPEQNDHEEDTEVTEQERGRLSQLWSDPYHLQVSPGSNTILEEPEQQTGASLGSIRDTVTQPVGLRQPGEPDCELTPRQLLMSSVCSLALERDHPVRFLEQHKGVKSVRLERTSKYSSLLALCSGETKTSKGHQKFLRPKKRDPCFAVVALKSYEHLKETSSNVSTGRTRLWQGSHSGLRRLANEFPVKLIAHLLEEPGIDRVVLTGAGAGGCMAAFLLLGCFYESLVSPAAPLIHSGKLMMVGFNCPLMVDQDFAQDIANSGIAYLCHFVRDQDDVIPGVFLLAESIKQDVTSSAALMAPSVLDLLEVIAKPAGTAMANPWDLASVTRGAQYLHSMLDKSYIPIHAPFGQWISVADGQARPATSSAEVLEAVRQLPKWLQHTLSSNNDKTIEALRERVTGFSSQDYIVKVLQELHGDKLSSRSYGDVAKRPFEAATVKFRTSHCSAFLREKSKIVVQLRGQRLHLVHSVDVSIAHETFKTSRSDFEEINGTELSFTITSPVDFTTVTVKVDAYFSESITFPVRKFASVLDPRMLHFSRNMPSELFSMTVEFARLLKTMNVENADSEMEEKLNLQAEDALGNVNAMILLIPAEWLLVVEACVGSLLSKSPDVSNNEARHMQDCLYKIEEDVISRQVSDHLFNCATGLQGLLQTSEGSNKLFQHLRPKIAEVVRAQLSDVTELETRFDVPIMESISAVELGWLSMMNDEIMGSDFSKVQSVSTLPQLLINALQTTLVPLYYSREGTESVKQAFKTAPQWLVKGAAGFGVGLFGLMTYAVEASIGKRNTILKTSKRLFQGVWKDIALQKGLSIGGSLLDFNAKDSNGSSSLENAHIGYNAKLDIFLRAFYKEEDVMPLLSKHSVFVEKENKIVEHLEKVFFPTLRTSPRQVYVPLMEQLLSHWDDIFVLESIPLCRTIPRHRPIVCLYLELILRTYWMREQLSMFSAVGFIGPSGVGKSFALAQMFGIDARHGKESAARTHHISFYLHKHTVVIDVPGSNHLKEDLKVSYWFGSRFVTNVVVLLSITNAIVMDVGRLLLDMLSTERPFHLVYNKADEVVRDYMQKYYRNVSDGKQTRAEFIEAAVLNLQNTLEDAVEQLQAFIAEEYTAAFSAARFHPKLAWLNRGPAKVLLPAVEYELMEEICSTCGVLSLDQLRAELDQ